MTSATEINARVLGALIALAFWTSAGHAAAKDISIVGSSTVYPFMKKLVEEHNSASEAKAMLESTGTGTGFSYFCAGTDDYLPDINNASSPMDRDEFRTCRRNGVRGILGLTIGYDGVVAFASVDNAIDALTQDHLYRAIAADADAAGPLDTNPFRRWSDIDARLPAQNIMVLGPPSSSGTRTYVENFVVGEPCIAEMRIMGRRLTPELRHRCEGIRTDGAYVDVGEDDAFLIQSVAASRDAIGLVGYGNYVLHQSGVKAITIDGIEPSFDNIKMQRYQLSRPLFVYVKIQRLTRNAAIVELLNRLLSEEMTGPQGALTKLGLVPPPADLAARNRRSLDEMTPIDCPSEYCIDGQRR
jgi:phosphate transport system substrate-binding protein